MSYDKNHNYNMNQDDSKVMNSQVTVHAIDAAWLCATQHGCGGAFANLPF